MPIGQLNDEIAPPAHTLRVLPLEQVRIDPSQPRQYLPAQFRQRAAEGGAQALAIMNELIRRAELEDDLEAKGYLDGIQSLATSISTVGLQQPVRVTSEHNKMGEPVYRIVDGERRYWAMLYRSLQTDPERALAGQIAVILSDAVNSADDIQRAQWAANLYHEAISVVDYADAVWRIREDFLARLDSERTRYLSELGPSAETMSLSDAAIQLTINEMTRLTGRILQRRNLYRYLAVAEKLSPPAKALARAHNLGLRTLLTLSRWQDDKQVEAITAMIQAGDDDGDESKTEGNSSPKLGHGGRPSSLRRSINGCITLISVLQQLSEQNLTKNTSDDLSALSSELERAATEVARARQLLQGHLSNEH